MTLLAKNTLAEVKTLPRHESDSAVYHYTNNSGTVLSSLRRLSVASRPSRVSLVAVRNYCAICSSYIYQVAQFTLSAVWGVQSCLSTYKYSVRLRQCNSPCGLYLEAHYNGFSVLDAMQGIMPKIIRGIMMIGISALALSVQLLQCMIGICANR